MRMSGVLSLEWFTGREIALVVPHSIDRIEQ